MANLRQKRKISLNRKIENKGKDTLQKDTEKLVRQANARLDSLQRRYKKGTWASKRLMKKLNTNVIKGWNTKSGKIKISKNMSRTQLRAINKAASQFLNSLTSTKKGIEEVRNKTIKTLKGTLTTNLELEEITDEEAEFFYDMFGDRDFQTLAEKIGASALQACIEDAIEKNDSEDNFIKRLGWYSGTDMNDLDIRDIAIRVYDKYVA